MIEWQEGMKIFVADFILRNGDLSPKKTAVVIGAFDMADARARFKQLYPCGEITRLDVR